MRRHLPRLAAVATLCTVAFVILPINADPSSPETLFVIVYPVADLPVYTAPRGEKPEFKPDLLITLIQAKVDPDSWEAGGSVSVHDRTNSLIIRQTKANHNLIADLMSRFRKSDPREQTEKLSKADAVE
jgi:hypothetical protein